jgi:hypothetical protein
MCFAKRQNMNRRLLASASAVFFACLAAFGLPACDTCNYLLAVTPTCNRVIDGDQPVCAAGLTCLSFTDTGSPAEPWSFDNTCPLPASPEPKGEAALCIDCAHPHNDSERAACANPATTADPLGLPSDEFEHGAAFSTCRVAQGKMAACNGQLVCKLVSGADPTCLDCTPGRESALNAEQVAACQDPAADDPSGLPPGAGEGEGE